ncbi:MAG: 2-oxoacid:acceptor oxidoreductase family protein [Planctomycetota bacterium]|jgi:2-oxoglutarate ferredoxin oxidoreductase subunit gamma
MSENHFHEEIIIAGFGGQGIMLTGRLLAQTAMEAGREVTYMPSYGAEVRGGTANCMVVVASDAIASPLVSNPDSLIVMNKASLQKFLPRLKEGGLLIYNSSLIEQNDLEEISGRNNVLSVPANELAVELGSVKAANMVAIGAFLQKRGLFSPDAAAKSLPKVLAKRYHKTLPINTKALHRGAEYAQSSQKS